MRICIALKRDRKRECADRTVADKHNRVKSWFLFAGLDYKNILPLTPKFDKKLPHHLYPRRDQFHSCGSRA